MTSLKSIVGGVIGALSLAFAAPATADVLVVYDTGDLTNSSGSPIYYDLLGGGVYDVHLTASDPAIFQGFWGAIWSPEIRVAPGHPLAGELIYKGHDSYPIGVGPQVISTDYSFSFEIPMDIVLADGDDYPLVFYPKPEYVDAPKVGVIKFEDPYLGLLISAQQQYETPLAYTVTVTKRDAAVPEPATWALMLTGFGAAGAMLRRRRRGLAGVW